MIFVKIYGSAVKLITTSPLAAQFMENLRHLDVKRALANDI